jgi:hypothetical protein
MTDNAAAKPNPYRMFKTDPELENKGVHFEYDGMFRVLCGRAGGSNKQFLKTLAKNAKPHERAIQMKLMSDEAAEQIVLDSFVDGVILGWDVNDNYGKVDAEKRPLPAKWVPGVHDPETNEVVPPSREAYLKVLTALPELFADLRAQTAQVSAFLQETREVSGKNS